MIKFCGIDVVSQEGLKDVSVLTYPKHWFKTEREWLESVVIIKNVGELEEWCKIHVKILVSGRHI